MSYFEFLCDMINIKPGSYKENYSLLAHQLFKKRYYYSLPMDENRDIDGRNLRELYLDSGGTEAVLDGPASVLEVLIALARRCDADIMYDNVLGDRTEVWFWMFLSNIGLDLYVNRIYEEAAVDDVLNTWLDREIGYNGEGGLFPLDYSDVHQNSVELWKQMLYFLDSRYV